MESFLSDGDNKNDLITLFAKCLKSQEIEEYLKHVVWYVIINIRDYVRTFVYFTKI